ncbi:hypothetical protein OUZ56_016392 [Daphnia magna]|uniref:HTH psq-type domain-containing protein n=1 Tax=Daphnia magna TaxID=35525 RepID=A0ABR0AQH9_9CRUS|nr:hypothetical protein OUZ56_016392 [Daphnia magna]
MPRNYIAKRKKPIEESLHGAISDVLSGKSSIRKSAEKFNLKPSTVAFYTKRFSSSGLFPPAQIKQYLKKCTLFNHGLSPKETRVIALSFAIANGTRFLLRKLQNCRMGHTKKLLLQKISLLDSNQQEFFLLIVPVDCARTSPNASTTSDLDSSLDPLSSAPASALASSLNPLSSAPASSLDPSSSALASSLNPLSSAPASSLDPSSSAPASLLNPLSSAPASSLNHASSPPFCSPLESVVAVSLEEIRPLTQVNQNIPLAKRPRANNRAGSTRILTDTPEKMKIDEENRRKEEKDIKKKERERKKLAKKNIFKPADRKNIEKKARKSNRNENEEETINVNEEDDENYNTQEKTVTQITPCKGMATKHIHARSFIFKY